MKYSHNVIIAGESLYLCSEDAPDYVEKLATELTRRINTTMLSGADVSTTAAATACALDLLDENVKLKSILKENANVGK